MDIFFNSFSNQVFLWLVKNKHLVIKLFFLAHILQAINILTASFFVARIADGNEIGVLFYDLGGKFGTLAALAFLVTTTPGIAKRFKGKVDRTGGTSALWLFHSMFRRGNFVDKEQ